MVWTVSGGFATLVDAQTQTGLPRGLNWGGLSLTEQKTILRITTEDDDIKDAVLGGEDRNQIVLNLEARSKGVSGSANFKLAYKPLGVNTGEGTSLWIIRNGVNDEAQNSKTTFARDGNGKILWKGTTADKENGNGAVGFEFVDQEISHIDLTGLVPAPVTGVVVPTTLRSEGRYQTTKVDWKAVVGGNLTDRFERETVYMATVILEPEGGFQFSTGGATVTHGGSSGIFYVSGDASKVVVEVIFPKTGAFWEYGGHLFSGSSSSAEIDSAIDVIIQANKENYSALFLKLLPWPETVTLVAGTDIGATGLVLTAAANSPAEVILDGGGKTIALSGNPGASVITVGNGVTLTLQNITFQGTVGTNGNTKALITVEAGGTLILEDGAVITGNKGSSANGGGVLVTGAGSKLVMKGGTISGNTNSGVRVASSGTFTMNGGTISGNQGTNGGVYVNGGNNQVFMNGGEISGNTSGTGVNLSSTNGVFAMKGGVSVSGGTFTMSGNAGISGNTGVGVVTSGTFTMSGGTISGNTGVGVATSGAFNMSGGTIGGNTPSHANAGGVSVSDGTFTMSGNAGISGNTGSTVGGVYMSKGTFTMSGDAIISKNTNTGANGGGVYVNGGNSKFNMNGGTISGNTGGGKYEADGGVYVFGSTTATGTYGTFIMTDGKIIGNTSGAGVGIDHTGKFEMSGGTISDNGNVTAKYGGGVRLGSLFESITGNKLHDQATFTMTGGEITGNIALSTITPTNNTNIGEGGGGGVWMCGDTNVSGGNMENKFTMSGDAVIHGNTGGGVAVGLGAQFTMDGGTISGNTSNYGGGVFLFGTPATTYYTQFIKTGGILYGNVGASPNVASSGTEAGHAVYYQAAQNRGTGDYYRDDTADMGDKITVEARISSGVFTGLFAK
jgi:hypothetical protein